MDTAVPLVFDDPAYLGPFRLIARLGSGGMGTVYLGRSPRGRTVALKTMHPEFATQTDFLTRFRLEIDAARVIGGQYGAEVVDADPLAETPWLATEYVIGPSLDEAVTACGTLPEEAVRVLGAALCEALAQLHRSDVVHRDLKPSNILLAATGPKVIDFGIARAAGDDRLTQTGAAAGTPAYMSPEQATGREHGPAGDVFALSGVLVFALTGQGPFGGGQAADLLYRVRYGEPDLSGVPDGIRPLIARCLAKEPESRPTTNELAELLADGDIDFADSLPDTVHAEILRRASAVWDVQQPMRAPAATSDMTTEPAVPNGRRAWSRRRVLATAAGVVALGGGAGGAWMSLSEDPGGEGQRQEGRQSPGGAPKAVWKKNPPGWDGVVPLVVGDYCVLWSSYGLKTVRAGSGKVQGTKHDVSRSLPVTDGTTLYGVDYRNEAITRIDVTTGNVVRPIAQFADVEIVAPRLLAAHDGKLIMQGLLRTGDEKSSQQVGIDAETGEVQWREPFGDRNPDVRVTAMTSDLVVFTAAYEDGVWAVDARTGEEAWSTRLPELQAEGSSIRNDVYVHGGSHIYISAEEVLALRIADGKIDWTFGKDRELTEEQRQAQIVYGPVAVRDDLLYAVERGNGVVALDAATGKLRWELETAWPDEAPLQGAPVAGNQYIYFPMDGERWITAVDPEERTEEWTFVGPDRFGSSALVAHDEARRLIAVRGDTAIALPLE